MEKRNHEHYMDTVPYNVITKIEKENEQKRLVRLKIAYDPNDKFYRYGISCMHNSSSGWGFGYAPGKDDKKYLTVEEAKQAAIIEIADRHSYCCFGKTLRDILIESGYLQPVNSISLWD